MRRFSYSPLWLARSLVGLVRNPERPSSRGRDRPGLLLETPCRVPLRALMSGMLTRLNQEQKSIKLTNILKSQNLQKNTQKNLKGSHQKDQKETWWT
jgi:hypothetical protein